MITSIQPNITSKQQKKQNFKGAPELLATGLNFLNTNPSLGAVFVDVAFMDTPRTVVDTYRNPDAGVETATREFSSTINHGVAGFVGLGAGWLAARQFNKENNVKAHLLFTNNDALDIFSKFHEETKGSNDYYKRILESVQAYNTSSSKETPLKPLSKETIENTAKILNSANTNSYKIPKDVRTKARFEIIADTGSSETFKIVKKVKDSSGALVEKTVTGTIDNLLDWAFSIKKAYLDKASNTASDKLTDAQFLESLKKIKTKTIAGLAVPVAIGMSLQPFNAYMTKKRTGKEGFVGSEGREPDKSTGFKVLKTAMGAGIAAAMLRTIAPYKQILPQLQYKGLVPTIPQFKLIYAMTIFSRLLAARDKDELRESTIKDTLGFVNWLILGGFVSKIAANSFKKDLINYDEKTMGYNGKSKISRGWNWITKAVEKTHEEILFPALKKAGINVLDEKGKPLSYGSLMKALKEKAAAPDASKEIKEAFELAGKRIKYKNTAQILGYLYSGLVLGIGIPKLNIAITNHIDKKRAAKKAGKEQNCAKTVIHSDFNKNQSKAFASFLGTMS